jgi:hypothetical protein
MVGTEMVPETSVSSRSDDGDRISLKRRYHHGLMMGIECP